MNIKNKYSSTAKIEYTPHVHHKDLSYKTFAVSLYVNDIKQTVNCDLFLYADDSCLVYQPNDVRKIAESK